MKSCLIHVERFNQTVQEEFYKVALPSKFYRSLEEIQSDLNEFMSWYNNERTNQGRNQMQTCIDGLRLYQQYVYEEVEEKISRSKITLPGRQPVNTITVYRT